MSACHRLCYVISVSYGNDSVAMIQWAHEQRLHGVVVAYCDTGWAAPSWAQRVEHCEAYEELGPINLDGIHWVIVGGESGPKARPMRAEWVKAIQAQAEVAGTAFFFKQWGLGGADGVRRSKKANGRTFNGRTWEEMPLPFG